MEIDKRGLEDRIFEVFAQSTNERAYLFVRNQETHVTRWSLNAVEYFQMPGEYMTDVDSFWEPRIHPDDLAEYRQKMDNILSGRCKWENFEYRIMNQDGKYVVCTCKCTILHGENGEPDLFSGTIINRGIGDIIDAVTLLHTNQGFVEHLKLLIDKKRRAAVMDLEISKFSRINVLYGYQAGNEVLLRMADLIRSQIGDQGIAYYLDGSKYVLLLPDMTESEAGEIYDRLQQLAKTEIYIGENLTVPIKLSGGATILEDFDGTPSQVKSTLAYALNQSKYEGRGRLVWIGINSEKDQQNNVEMLGRIHQSIIDECKGFYMCYQPLVDVRTEKIVGAEALIRWRSEADGEVSPGRFIPWLEGDAAYYELGKWILRQALHDATEFRKTLPEFIINVNITASQFERKEFREDVCRIVEESGYPPQQIFMELTERCRQLDCDFLKTEMAFFHARGFKVSLDDFGTGSSSLGLVMELPIDELKVDMSFIKDIQKKRVNQAMVKHIVECANSLGLKTCIEGVENKELSIFLRPNDASYYQGYYYSKPVPAEDFIRLL